MLTPGIGPVDKGTRMTGTTQTSPFSKLLQTNSTHYNTPAVQVGNTIRDGDSFVLIRTNSTGGQPEVWSSGNQQETQKLFEQVVGS